MNNKYFGNIMNISELNKLYSPQVYNSNQENKYNITNNSENSYKRLLESINNYNTEVNLNSINENNSIENINNNENRKRLSTFENIIDSNQNNENFNNKQYEPNEIINKEETLPLSITLSKKYSNINEKEIDISADFNEIQKEINKYDINDIINDENCEENNKNQELLKNNEEITDNNEDDILDSNHYKRCRFFSA